MARTGQAGFAPCFHYDTAKRHPQKRRGFRNPARQLCQQCWHNNPMPSTPCFSH